MQDQGMYEQSLAACEQVLAAFETPGLQDPELKVSALQTAIGDLDELGRYDEAIYYCKQIEDISSDDFLNERAYAQADMSSFYAITGNIRGAAKSAFKSLKTAQKYISTNSQTWLQTADYDAFIEGAELLEYVSRQVFAALSDSYAAADEESRALLVEEFDIPAYKQLMQAAYEQLSEYVLHTRSGSPRHQVFCRQRDAYRAILCEIMQLESDFASSEPKRRALLQDILQINRLPYEYELRASARMGASYAQEGQYDSAQIWWDKVSLLDTLGTYAGVLRENQAWTAIQLNDWDRALPLLQEGMEQRRQHLKSEFVWLSSRSRQRTWMNNYAWYFVQNIALCVHAQHPASVNAFIYDNVLLEKGILLSTEAELEQLLRESGGRAVLDSLYALRHLRHQLYLSERDEKIHPDSIADRKRIAASLEMQILRECHEAGDFTRLLDLTWRDVQSRLDKQDVAVEFVLADDADGEYWMNALLLRKGWKYPQLITIGKMRQLDEWCTAPDLYENKEIAAHIWQPIIDAAGIKKGEKIYFSPDGIFYLTGIEYMLLDSGSMFDNYDMVRLSSTRELCRHTIQNDSSEAVLYGGVRYARDETDQRIEYLSSTLAEVQYIDSILPHSVLYAGLDATEESFKGMSGHAPKMLHMATHGFYLKNKKAQSMMQKNVQFVRLTEKQKINIEDYALARSGLLMANSSSSWTGDNSPRMGNDGILTAKEIAALDLHKTELVVLSACKSGLGDITVDGIAGLQRGFKKAGVHAMLMSLWPIDDTASQLFMQEFYNGLLAGYSKQSALRHAQQTLRALPDYDHPRYWAAFVLLDAI